MPSIIDRGQPDGIPELLRRPDEVPQWAKDNPGRYTPEQIRILSLPGGPLGPYNNQEIDSLRRDRNAGDVLGDVLKGLLMGGIPGAIGEGIFGPQKRETDVTKELRRKGNAYLADEPFREARSNELKRIWAEQDRTAQQARQGMGMFREAMGLQNDLADQAMQTQWFAWEQEDRNAKSAETRQKVDAAKALRTQYDSANMAQVNAYAQAIQKVGKPYSPDTLSAATAMAKILEPREFQIWAKDLFETEAGGGDATDMKAKALVGFAEFIKAQRDAEYLEADLKLREVDANLKALVDMGASDGKGGGADKDEIRYVRKLRQHRSEMRTIKLLEKSYSWNPDIGTRSMTLYNQMFSVGNPAGWMEAKYLDLAEREFMLDNDGRPPQSPEDIEMVKQRARELAANGGWEP